MCKYAAKCKIHEHQSINQPTDYESKRQLVNNESKILQVLLYLLESLNGIELLKDASAGIDSFGSERLGPARHIRRRRCPTPVSRHGLIDGWNRFGKGSWNGKEECLRGICRRSFDGFDGLIGVGCMRGATWNTAISWQYVAVWPLVFDMLQNAWR